eukprot:TRINITY_DN1676_c0_g1_i1.p1 TRINITY_DN1676_c0_g1~~TRINITY_DN1676_c0_g1_i1.p1  ORF type:complete len:437 (-),score=85.77 TRINITY_DN1676_c0_g1_i1:26-1336(-)
MPTPSRNLAGRSVKVQIIDDVRRIQLKSSSYQDFLDAVCTVFVLRSSSQWNTFYKDDDGDNVNVTNDVELISAVEFAEKSDTTARFLIKPSSEKEELFCSNLHNSMLTSSPLKKSTQESANAPTSPSPTKSQIKISVAHNAICDLCKQQIYGIRYKCGHCEDFDLCESCESARPHERNHVFLKIYDPVMTLSGPLLPEMYVPRASNLNPRPSHVNRRREPPIAEFVKDVNMEDVATLHPGDMFVKTWRMKNTGTTRWPEDIRLVNTEGQPLGPISSVLVASASPGEEIDISVELIAPQEEGRYVSYWRLADENRIQFGHRVWVDITVAKKRKEETPAQKSTEPVSVPIATPAPIITPVPVICPVPVAAPAPIVTPVPVNEAVAPVQPAEVLPSGVRMEDIVKLEELGFGHNRQKVIALLQQYEGDLVKCVVALLDS